MDNRCMLFPIFLPVKALNREPAGHAFHSAALKLHGCADNEDCDKKVGDDKEKEYVPSFNSYANKGKKKSAIVKHHPDILATLLLAEETEEANEAKKEEIESRFIAIQECLVQLFKRNARWSVNQRIPDLGDEYSPLKDADKFYNFCYAFKSLREFPDEEEHDLEQADSREERRWMEKENAKKKLCRLERRSMLESGLLLTMHIEKTREL
ncbi:hypothetical protein ISN44_As08g007080 [Arabidopsis suecica]|uniref:Zuotin-like zuotin homology domain-containing protein n=1 Tax=Arabidopsis suecica TaxID=45249 RepID=A0A8T2B5X3_ARASU|nr:hypothetical protein ISN44_As08g007080 [Arabidopsis suecica]